MTIARQHARIAAVMRQLILNNIDVETAERLEVRAKRLGTTPEEEASRLLRERLRMDQDVEGANESGVDPRFVKAHGLLVFTGILAAEDVTLEDAQRIATSPPELEKEGTLYDLLMQGPNVGDDADFERPVDHGREQPAWDT